MTDRGDTHDGGGGQFRPVNMGDIASLGQRVGELSAKVGELAARKEWIPVESKLPEEDGDYLISEFGVVLQTYWAEGSFWLDTVVDKHQKTESRRIQPTHWQPLPRPPEAP